MMKLSVRGRPLVHCVNVLAASSYFLFGYDNGVMSGIITAPQFFAVFGNMSATMQGTVVSLFEVGAFFGAIACVWIGDPLGRRKTSFLGSAVMIIGAVLQAASYSRSQLIVGRLVSGVGIGALTSTTPPYLSECSTPAKRGRDIAIMLTSLIIGIVVSYWVDYGCNYMSGSGAFRLPLILQVLWNILICFMAVVLPDSPRWLYFRGREAEGLAALSALRDLPEDDPELRREADDILAAIALENEGSDWKAVLVDGGIRGNKRVALACITLIMQQLTGTNTLTYYSTIIYEQSVGLSRHLSLLMGGFLQLWFLAASFVTWFTIDRYGRRSLFMVGYFGMGACFLVLMGMLSFPGNKAAGIVATIATFLFQGFFTWGTMATTWCYPSEVLPLSLRTRGSAYTAAASWIFGFMIVEVTPLGIQSLGRFFYIIWAIFNFIMMALVYLFYPETANLPLEAIDLLFTGDEIDGYRYTDWRSAVKKSIEMHSATKHGRKARVDLEHMHLARQPVVKQVGLAGDQKAEVDTYE